MYSFNVDCKRTKYWSFLAVCVRVVPDKPLELEVYNTFGTIWTMKTSVHKL